MFSVCLFRSDIMIKCLVSSHYLYLVSFIFFIHWPFVVVVVVVLVNGCRRLCCSVNGLFLYLYIALDREVLTPDRQLIKYCLVKYFFYSICCQSEIAPFNLDVNFFFTLCYHFSARFSLTLPMLTQSCSFLFLHHIC